MNDPISDMLTRIRNANRVKKPAIELPYSLTKFSIAKILEREGWVARVEKIDTRFGAIRIELRYDDTGLPVIRELHRVSKPGRRVYVGKKELPVVLGGMGIAIVSTSSGIMSSREARKKGLGGEVMCEIF
ncbi:MAG: 30S ribosomal protein S8 [bacterium]